MPPIHTVSFRGNEFRIQEGSVHPEYSVNCFTEDESAFRDKYWHPKAGDVVVDVGASYGAYALTAAACGARVMAFEPEATVHCDLLENCKLNPGLSVEAICCGLWDEDGHVDMMTYAPHWPENTTSGWFKVRTLDSYELGRVDLMKVDVEGCELRVLRGAKETIARCRPTLIVEVHTFLNPALLVDCSREILAHGGYTVEEVPRDPCVMLIARPS